MESKKTSYKNHKIIFKALLIITLFSSQTLQAKVDKDNESKSDAMLFGDVKSTSDSEHIPYAYIFIKETKFMTMADGSGHFKLPNVPVGKITVVAKAMGYLSQEKEINISKGESINLFFELDEDHLSLEQIVVTGTRSNHFIKDAPVLTEVLTSSAIEKKGAANVYQALQGIPGIRVENQCQSCNFTMVRMQGLGAEHTQVLINGMPLYSGLAGVYGLQQVSTMDLDKIEVVKGAGSALYGSGAVAGAINLVTKEPSLVPRIDAGVQFGSYNTNKYDISASMRNERGNVGLAIYAQKYSEGIIDQTGEGMDINEVNNKDGFSDRVSTNLTNAGFTLYLEDPFLKNEQLVIQAKSIFEKRRGGEITDDIYKNPYTEGTEDILTDRYEISTNYSKAIGERGEFNFSAAFVLHNREATNDAFLNDYQDANNGLLPELNLMRPYLAKEKMFTSAITYNHKLGNHKLIGGVQILKDNMDESGMYVVMDEDNTMYGKGYKSLSNKSASEVGVFVQDEWSIGEKLVLVPGVRADHHNSSEEYRADNNSSAGAGETNYFPIAKFNKNTINPRLAVKYTLLERVTLRGSIGSGFRAPYGFSEDLHLCSGSPRVWKSSGLNPEKSLSYNLSADYYGKKLRFTANIFRTQLKDKIAYTVAPEEVKNFGYSYEWVNIGDAIVAGVELSTTVALLKNLNLGAGFTLNNGTLSKARAEWIGTQYESDSKYISRFPKTTANINLEYSPSSWFFSLNGDYQGKMYIDYYNTDINPAIGDQSKIKFTKPFMLFNALASKKIGGVKFDLGINNIFSHIQDERHLDDAAFIYAPLYGRTFFGGITIAL